MPSGETRGATAPDTTDAGTRASVHPRVLLIDDDEKWCRIMHNYLTRHRLSVTTVLNGKTGIHRALSQNWELIVLDVMLPDVDGFEVLQRIREQSSVPILMLTARGDEADRIDGLEFGADDYVPKTFSTPELIARIKAVIRRGSNNFPSQVKDSILIVGGLRIQLDSFRVFLDDAEIALSPVEYALLVSLARTKGKVRSRDELFAEISARQTLTVRAIDVHISTLRRKLGDNPDAPRYIRTSRGHGYMLVDPSVP